LILTEANVSDISPHQRPTAADNRNKTLSYT